MAIVLFLEKYIWCGEKLSDTESKFYSACLVHLWFVCNIALSLLSSFSKTFLPAVGSSKRVCEPVSSRKLSQRFQNL